MLVICEVVAPVRCKAAAPDRFRRAAPRIALTLFIFLLCVLFLFVNSAAIRRLLYGLHPKTV